MKVLITGIAGKAGRLVTLRLLERGYSVLGIDRRGWAECPEGVQVFREDIRKRGAEEIFRRERPDAVVHMATVTHLLRRSEDRYRINMQGTRAIFDHSHNYKVKQVIFVGRHTFYGASAVSPLYPTEDAPPSSVNSFPELSDLVSADLYAGSALWRYPELSTCVLRICYTLGPACHGTLASYLKGKRVASVLGFDPLFQFMHDQDMAEAICISIDRKLRGVFNVAGPMPIPLSVLIRETGRKQIPVPEFLFRKVVGKAGIPHLPKGAVAHIKYPIVMDCSAFKKATDFQFQFDHEETIEQFTQACPVPD